MDELQKKLYAPFPATEIEWRISRVINTKNGSKGIVLAYVTNRAIMNRLDEVFGVGGWRNEYKEWRDKGILCGISAKFGDEWITKYDGAEETQFEATKGGFSGAMKRAAVQFGIGRYLYNLDETWVDIKERGENYINDKKTGIKGYWNTPDLPAWALPESKKGNIKAKYTTLKYPVGKFEAWYKKKSLEMSDNEIEKKLTEELIKKKENAS